MVAASFALAPAAGASNGIGALPAQQIVKKSIAATTTASSVTVSGAIATTSQTVSLHVTSAKGIGFGTFTYNGQTLTVVKTTKHTYFKATQSFWTTAAGATAAQLFANKWVISDAIGSSFASFFDTRQLLRTSNLTTSVFVKTGAATVNGQPAVIVTGHDKTNAASAGKLYVATNGPPYILRLAATTKGTNAGVLNFTNYNQAVHLTVPAHPLNLNSLGSGSQG